MKEHLDELLDNERFELFVITTHDGFSIDKPEAVHCQLPIVGAQRGASNPQPANYPGGW